VTDLGPPSFDVVGPESAPPIVFVHGTRLSRATWRAQVEALSGDYLVVTMDLPGHGSLVDRTFTLEGAADELGRVIESAAGGRAVVVGLSLGGYVAMDLAARRPEMVRALVLSGATLEPIGGAAPLYRALAWVMDRVSPGTFARLVRPFVRGPYAVALSEPPVSGTPGRDGAGVALRALIGERFAPRLARYDGPVLIVNGDLDVLFRLGARSFAREALDVRRVRLKGALHLANLDQPEAFTAAIRKFVEGLGGRP
jgi:pimeloyl-ACP methyl ester carboxylesterase